jgi:hypothetical protein
MTAKVITTMTGLLDAIRARRDELDLSHETIDAIAGFPGGYTSKLLAPVPLRGISHMSLTAVLGALCIGLVVVEDAVAREKVEDRWQPRKRPPTNRKPTGALLAQVAERIVSSTSGGADVQTTFEFPGEPRTCRTDQSCSGG